MTGHRVALRALLSSAALLVPLATGEPALACSLPDALPAAVDCPGAGDDGGVTTLTYTPDADGALDLLELSAGGEPLTTIGDDDVLGGNDAIRLAPGYAGTLALETALFNGELILPAMDLGTGDDLVSVAGGTLSSNTLGGGDGDDRFIFSGGALASVLVDGGGGDDAFTVDGSDISANLSGGDGNDAFTLSSGRVTGAIDGAGGADSFIVDGATVSGRRAVDGEVPSLAGGNGADRFTIRAGRVDPGIGSIALAGDAGNDSVVLEGGTVAGALSLGDGDDRFTMTGGRIDDFDTGEGVIPGAAYGDAGNDTLAVSGGTIAAGLSGGDGDDTLSVSGTADIGIGLRGDAGDDTIIVSGGTIGRAGAEGAGILGGDGNDRVTVAGGTVTGVIDGEAGTDSVAVTGGTVAGDITAESVTLSGGTVTGDIAGLTGNTLTIDGPVTLRDGATIAGTRAAGLVSAASLPALRFVGFDRLGVSGGATLGLVAGDQGIAALTLSDGARLRPARGTTSLGAGTLAVDGATVDMQNGVTGDVLSVSIARLANATLALDVNLADGTSDTIAARTVRAGAGNVIDLAVIDGAIRPGQRLVAILPVAGETQPLPGGTPFDGFTLTGLPPGLAADLLAGSGGGLYAAVGPDATALMLSDPTAPSNAAVAATYQFALDDFLGQTLDAFTAQGAASRAGVQTSDLFGIFAFGRAGRLDHDGYDIAGPDGIAKGASFTANDFSVIASGEYDIARAQGTADRRHLKAGVFLGYASTDVDVDASGTGPTLMQGGSGTNQSGMAGAYVVLGQGATYALASITGFWGSTDVDFDGRDASGSYDTSGYGLTATVGRQVPLDATRTLDLRGSVGYLSFEGDAFTDSAGFDYGSSEVSFGFIKLQPALYWSVPVDDTVVRPYLRAELSQRFDYRNTASFEGEDFAYSDADLSVAAMLGADYAVRGDLTVSGEIAGYTSADMSAVTAKLGLKYAF